MPRRSEVKLTKRVVDALKPVGNVPYVLWDSEIPGFGVRVHPSGAKTFTLKTRIAGRQVEMKLGRYGADLTVDQARDLAMSKRGDIAEGGDPAAVRRAWAKAPTVKAAKEEFMAQHVKTKLKPRTAQVYGWDFDKKILPRLGALKIKDVGVEDLRRFHHALRGEPSLANQCLRVLSKLLNWAEQVGYRDVNSNPTKLVEKFHETQRTCELSDEQLAALGAALDAEEADSKHTSIPTLMLRLLLLTGARRGEIVGLRWDELDQDRGVIIKTDHKTSRKVGKKVIPLNVPALAVLARVPKQLGNPLVFPYNTEDAAVVALRRAWHRVREAAGLVHVRPHDLRHIHASVAISGGMSLEFVGGILGHKDKRVTQRYAHLAQNTVKAASESVGFDLMAKLNPEKKPIKPLKKKRA